MLIAVPPRGRRKRGYVRFRTWLRTGTDLHLEPPLSRWQPELDAFLCGMGIVAVVVFWRVRRRRRATAPGAWMEASCPACIGVSLLAGRVPGLAGLATPDPVRPEPGDEPKVLVS